MFRESISIPDSETNYHATMFNTVWQWPMDKLIHEWNGMGIQEAKSILYNHLVYTIGDIQIQRRGCTLIRIWGY